MENGLGELNFTKIFGGRTFTALFGNLTFWSILTLKNFEIEIVFVIVKYPWSLSFGGKREIKSTPKT